MFITEFREKETQKRKKLAAQGASIRPQRSEPDTLLLDGAHAVLSLGSTGGGSLFVLDGQTARVLLLPPGPLHDGKYDANGLDVREIATNVEQFIEKLTLDVRAFVKDTEHIYLA